MSRPRSKGRWPLVLGGLLLAAPFALARLDVTASWVGPPDPSARAAMGRAQRSLGPLASVAASVEWARFRRALLRGETAEAYVIADRALALDPSGEGGWLNYAQHLIFERGSFAENETPEGRRRWIKSGLELLKRGEALCRTPAELAFMSGLIRTGYLAPIPDSDLGWPGGPTGLLAEGTEDLQRAATAGHTGATETLEALRAARSILPTTLPDPSKPPEEAKDNK